MRMALYLWHHRSGYMKEFSFPEDYKIDKNVIQLLFFYVLGPYRRRTETLYSRISIRGKTYYWYYFGANRDEPTLLVIESDEQKLTPLLLTLALYLKFTNFKEISPLGLTGLTELINRSKDIKELVFNLAAMNKTIISILDLIYRAGVTTFSNLIKDSLSIEPTPSIRDIMEIMIILRWLGLINTYYPSDASDTIITYNKVIYITPRIDGEYLKKIKEMSKENFQAIKIAITREIRELMNPQYLKERFTDLVKIINFERYAKFFSRFKKYGLIEPEHLSGEEQRILEELLELGVASRYLGRVFLVYEPTLNLIDEKELDRLGYLKITTLDAIISKYKY